MTTNEAEDSSLGDAQLMIVSGDGQEGQVASYLLEPLVVKVVDAAGTSLSNAPVEWVFAQGGGTVGTGQPSERIRTLTDATGTASVRWQTGTTAGTQSASAEIVLSPSPVSGMDGPSSAPNNNNGKKVGFLARARPGDVASIAVSPSNSTLAVGDSLQLSASAVDSFGNAIDGLSFQWTSSNEAVAQVSDRGRVYTVNTGSASAFAKYKSVEGKASITSTDVSTGTALSAGVASVSAGDGLIVLTATGATGGTPPYAYQWHRSTTGGFSPSASTQLSGFTSLQQTDANVTNGTTYYYRLLVTDDAGTVRSYGEVRATPATAPPPPEPGALNEPAGMTRLLSFDGTTKNWDTNGRVTLWGAKYGDPAEGSTGPFSGRWSVVDAPDNPAGTGKALRQQWEIGDGSGFNGVLAQDWRIGGANLDEVYVRFRLKFSSNWEHHAGSEKINYWGTGVQASNYFLNYRRDGGLALATQEDNPGTDNGFYYLGDSAGNNVSISEGVWVTIEIHMIANSTSSSSDGSLKMWVDGVLVDHYVDGKNGNSTEDLADGARQWSTDTDPGFRAAEWFFWGGSGDTKSVKDHIDWGEYYVSGKVN